ncbi:MAG: hypothetical protein ACLR56_10720 [Oscillospiraceae bacterium]
MVSYRLGLPCGCGNRALHGRLCLRRIAYLFDGTKATIKCTTPKYIMADLDVMKEAPLICFQAWRYVRYPEYSTGNWRDYNGDYCCKLPMK